MESIVNSATLRNAKQPSGFNRLFESHTLTKNAPRRVAVGAPGGKRAKSGKIAGYPR